MPPLFSATYTPIAAAGTQGQIKHVARLLATQLNAAGLGPGATVAKNQKVPVVSSNFISKSKIEFLLFSILLLSLHLKKKTT